MSYREGKCMIDFHKFKQIPNPSVQSGSNCSISSECVIVGIGLIVVLLILGFGLYYVFNIAFYTY